MKEKDLIKIAEWLNNKGYDIDLQDQLWMEEYDWHEFKTRDIIELMYDYHTEQTILCEVSISDAERYAEFCVRCDREKMPLLKIKDFLAHY